MIERMALAAAIGLNRITGNNNVNVDYVRYRLAGIINVLVIWFLSISLGFITQSVPKVLLALVVLLIFRYVTGGMHFPLDICMIVTVGIVFVSVNYHIGPLWLLHLVAIPLVVKFGNRLKYFGLVMILANFWIGSEVIANCFMIQAISLIPILGGDKHD